MDEILDYNELMFEDIKHANEFGQEVWYARELQGVLEYSKWDNFKNVIEKAKTSCETAGNVVAEHFADVRKSILTGYNTEKEIDDIELSRYACYLIVQNGDPRKSVIALGQTYFAIKTRQQEIQDEFENLSEEKKRLSIRTELKKHNKSLAEAAANAGIVDPMQFGVFQNHGYMGLYGGMKAKDIHTKKGLKSSQNILDHMGSTELAANLFRATQTDEKLRRENVKGAQEANKTHYDVGEKVRKTIAELGGTMPENLPTPKKSVKKIEKEENKRMQ